MTSFTQISYRNAFCMCWMLSFALLFYWQANLRGRHMFFPPRPIPNLRPHVFNLSDFGAVGDGTTDNTKCFEDAVVAIKEVAREGGGQLNVGPGRWLTAPFNVTSHMTLFLAQGATVVGSQDVNLWPILPPLPSYGRGRELPGPRYGSLIHGQHINDFVLTGHNGTIDGQGAWWWEQFKKKKLQYTRGRLVQFMWSSNIKITDVTLQNSPFWHLHPYDCTNVTIQGVTILAPVNAPNTDGIDPDSCRNVLVEDCYISVGDDAIAIKSGWDKYGIEYNRPCVNVTIRNMVVHSEISAGVSIGSEMSGGIEQVLVEGVHIWGSRRGIRIKTSPGRGGYVKNIHYQNVTLIDVRVGIVIKTDYGEHPDSEFDPEALPVVANISIDGIYGSSVRYPVRMFGSQEVPITGIEIRNMDVQLTSKKKNVFTCEFIQGRVIGKVFPTPCKALVQEEFAIV
ncbi:hypothetical protein KC19_1G067700 [Ceratodon purpureus]|uniref:Polygalacturonase n=1 Tax=Ceratodon purpureus TaxID=3225 RepID=A0A8T0J5I4_CERPU|nr:hypothetical protein KC19_1G067700 [Ceratodon purpureus]